MNDLFAKFKRLFEQRPHPAENVGEPTADRPPPRAAEPAPAPEPPPAVKNAEPEPPPPVEAPASREPASLHEDDLAEVRAALEAVAQAPVTVEPEPPQLEPQPEPESEVSPSLTFPAPPTEEPVDAPFPAAAHVGDALVLTLGTPPTTFTVAKNSATLGRGQENEIRLDDLSVSRRHARIAYRQGGYWLSDLGSMGGTWVDGTRLNAPRRIAAGEVIDIGLCRLTASFTVGAAKAETKKTASKPRSEVTAQVRRRR